MKLRKTVLSALLLAMGFVLHELVPGAIGGMKFDVQLAVLFVIIAINMDFKNTIATGLASGIITALTTTFPGGQLPNVIDKLITSIAAYLIFKALSRIANSQVAAALVGFIATIISGSVFLTSALYIVGLPAPFKVLFIGIVLPTAVTNIFATSLLYNLVHVSQRALKFEA